MAHSQMEMEWRGIYSLHTKSKRYTHFTQLGQTKSKNSETDLVQNVNVRNLDGTDWNNSVGWLLSAFWEPGYPDLPAYGPRRAFIDGLVWPIYDTNKSRPL